MSKLSDLCEKMYINEGQYAVYEFITSNYPKQPWGWCEPCDNRSPRDTDYACLVCGSPTTNYKDEEGDSNE